MSSKLTVAGFTTTNTLGTECYEAFTHKTGNNDKVYVAYDYRHTNGELFSCVKSTVCACRAARDVWLLSRGDK